MSQITVEKMTKEEARAQYGIDSWSPWEGGPSTFDWEYDTDETAYVLEGKVKVKTPTGEVEINKGDIVTFPKGLKCTWNVLQRIRKVYTFK